MNTYLNTRARAIIEEIKAELAPEQIARRVDDPITRVTGEFDFEPACPISHKDFHRIIASYVEQVYDRALGAPWMAMDPLAKAMSILQNSYQSAVYGSGYIAALLDANDPAEGGIQTVLTGLAESIKSVKQQEYRRAVFARYLNGCSWRLRCEIAQLLLADNRAFIPARLGKCAPAQLADEIPSLVSVFISSDSVLHQVAFLPETQHNGQPLCL